MARKSKEVLAMEAQEREWQAKDDARTLKRAAEIAQDKGRQSRAHTEINKELKALQTIAGKPTQPKKPSPPKPRATGGRKK